MEIYRSFHYICAWEMSFILQGVAARTLPTEKLHKVELSGIEIPNWPIQGADV